MTVLTSSFGSTTVGVGVGVCACALAAASTSAPAAATAASSCSHPYLPSCSETPRVPYAGAGEAVRPFTKRSRKWRRSARSQSRRARATNEDRGDAGPGDRHPRGAGRADRRRAELRAAELLARRADDLRRARRAGARGRGAGRAGRSGVLFDLQGPKLRLDGTVVEQTVAVGDQVALRGAGGVAAEGVPVGVRQARRAGHRALAARDRRRRAALRGRSASTGPDVVARAVSPGPLSARKGINVTYARPELPAITDKDVADLGARRGARRRLHRAVVRALGGGHRAAARDGAGARAAPPGWSPRSRRSRPTRRWTRSSPSATA